MSSILLVISEEDWAAHWAQRIHSLVRLENPEYFVLTVATSRRRHRRSLTELSPKRGFDSRDSWGNQNLHVAKNDFSDLISILIELKPLWILINRDLYPRVKAELARVTPYLNTLLVPLPLSPSQDVKPVSNETPHLWQMGSLELGEPAN